DTLALHLGFGNRQHPVHQLLDVGRSGTDLYGLAVMQKALHQLAHAANLVFHEHDLAHKIVRFLRELTRVTSPQLVKRQTSEVEWILYLVCQASRELAQGREPLEPVELMLTLASPAQLLNHLVEASSEEADFIAAVGLRHRREAARRDILRR